MKAFNNFFSLCSKVNSMGLIWNQGPGGNMSIKMEDILYIKPSGKRIHEIQNSSQLSQVKIKDVKADLLSLFSHSQRINPEEEYKLILQNGTLKNVPRPSMESGFHVLLSGHYVFHFHSIVAIGLAEFTARNGDSFTEFDIWFNKNWKEIFGNYTIIDPCLPGLELTKRIKEINSESAIYLLRNHGVILNFNDINLIDKYRDFELSAIMHFMPKESSQILKWKNKKYQEIITSNKELLTSPLKFYFPDMAIMYPNIKKFLKNVDSDKYNFLYEKILEGTSDQDALENWLAHSMLFYLWPQLPELSKQLINSIPQLPTEVARKSIIEEKS